MKKSNKIARHFMAGLCLTLSSVTWGYGTGADGRFNPTVDTQVPLPPDGALNYTEITIPAGVTVTFLRNTTNTPVTLLATEDVTIDGTIDVSGGNSADVGSAGDGNIGDDGLPGLGGPGGFDGGRGGLAGLLQGSEGLGPGGGRIPDSSLNTPNGARTGCGGSGAGYATVGGTSGAARNQRPGECDIRNRVGGGIIYGSETLLPLIGGSGGGGASSGDSFAGSGGGGGGGALLIASAETIAINGLINANGGNSGASSGIELGGSGGAGSGGAIRIIAETILGNGTINAFGGSAGTGDPGVVRGGDGAAGRIRFESNTFLRTATTTPAYSFSTPDELFVAGLPTISIASGAGVNAPAVPTGNGDIILPESTPNPVTIAFATTGVPVGNTVSLILTPASGEKITAVSAALVGTIDNATASVSVELPSGPSLLLAEVSFTVTVAMHDSLNLGQYVAENETVKYMKLSADPQKGSMTTLITDNGNEYTWPSNALAMR